MRSAALLLVLVIVASVSRIEAETPVAPVTATAEPPSTRQIALATARCRAGDEALQAHDAAAAAAAYGEALAVFPGHPGAHVGLGHAAMLRRDFRTALAEYERAESTWRALQETVERHRSERNQEAAEDAAVLMESTKRMSEESFDSATVAGMPHTSDVLKGAVLGNEVKNLQKAAEPSYAPRAAPPSVIAFFRGTALYRLGRIDEAVAVWLEVERREPKFGPVYNNLVEGLIRLGRKDDARATAKLAKQRGIGVHPDLLAVLEK